MAPEPFIERRFRCYRWAYALFGGWAACGLVLAIVLLVSITDVNAGYPAVFFGGLFVATATPICAICAVLAGISLLRGEPHRPVMITLAIVSVLVAWQSAGATLRFVTGLLHTLPR